MKSAMKYYGVDRQQQMDVEHLAELAVRDNENGFGSDATFADFPAMHDNLILTEPARSSTIRRFPSLSNSTYCSERSSTTLAEKEEPETMKDLEEDSGHLRPAPVGFFDSALSRTRIEVFEGYSKTRMMHSFHLSAAFD